MQNHQVARQFYSDVGATLQAFQIAHPAPLDAELRQLVEQQDSCLQRRATCVKRLSATMLTQGKPEKLAMAP